jgi:hypothetical protein
VGRRKKIKKIGFGRFFYRSAAGGSPAPHHRTGQTGKFMLHFRHQQKQGVNACNFLSFGDVSYHSVDSKYGGRLRNPRDAAVFYAEKQRI